MKKYLKNLKDFGLILQVLMLQEKIYTKMMVSLELWQQEL